MPRSGFSLTEAVVFSAIGLSVMVILFAIFQSTHRESARTQLHLKGIQAVYALMGRISQDLHGIVVFKDWINDTTHQLEVPARAPERVTFYRYDPVNRQPARPVADASGTLRPIDVDRVTYRFDRKKRLVFRQVNESREEPLQVARFLDVWFERVAQAPHSFAIHIRWVPEERLELPPDRVGEVLVFDAVLGLKGEALRAAEVHVQPNPTCKFTVRTL